MTHHQKIRNATILFITTLVLSTTTAAWANGPNTFTLEGTVRRCSCPTGFQTGLKSESAEDLTAASFRPIPACVLDLETGSIGGRYRTSLMAFDPGVVEACRWLTPGDPVLVLGSETAYGKVATHVALSLHGSRTTYDKAQLGGNQSSAAIDPNLFQLKAGGSIGFGDLKITFKGVVEDSRCPADVDCVRAGRVTIALATWQGKTYQGTYELTLGESSSAAEYKVGDYAVRLESVLPEPRTDRKPIDPSEYVITLRIWDDGGSDGGGAFGK